MPRGRRRRDRLAPTGAAARRLPRGFLGHDDEAHRQRRDLEAQAGAERRPGAGGPAGDPAGGGDGAGPARDQRRRGRPRHGCRRARHRVRARAERREPQSAQGEVRHAAGQLAQLAVDLTAGGAARQMLADTRPLPLAEPAHEQIREQARGVRGVLPHRRGHVLPEPLPAQTRLRAAKQCRDRVRADPQLRGDGRTGRALHLHHPQHDLPAVRERAEGAQHGRRFVVDELVGRLRGDLVELGDEDERLPLALPRVREIAHHREQVRAEAVHRAPADDRHLAEHQCERLGHQVLGVQRGDPAGQPHRRTDVAGPQLLIGLPASGTQLGQELLVCRHACPPSLGLAPGRCSSAGRSRTRGTPSLCGESRTAEK